MSTTTTTEQQRKAVEVSLAALDRMRATGRLRRVLVLADAEDTFALVGFGLQSHEIARLLACGHQALAQHREAAKAALARGETPPTTTGQPPADFDAPGPPTGPVAARPRQGQRVDTLARLWAEFEAEVAVGMPRQARSTTRSVFYAGASCALSLLNDKRRAGGDVAAGVEALHEEALRVATDAVTAQAMGEAMGGDGDGDAA